MGSFFSIFSSGGGGSKGKGKKHEVGGVTYKQKALLAEGGFGYVWLVNQTSPPPADDDPDGGVFALKQVRVQTPEARAAIEAEIGYLEALDHPNVIPLVAWSVSGDDGDDLTYRLVFPHCDMSLQDVLEIARAETPLAEDLVLELTMGICRGLLAMHSRDPPLAHCDLKPANVLLDTRGAGEDLPLGYGRPLLIDFGSARPAEVVIDSRREALAEQDRAAEFCTANYRAPELWDVPSHCVLDGRIDVWSLGCTVYALCFGRDAFEDGTLTSVRAGVRFPADHAYSADLERLILTMLERDAARRPTVQACLEAVEALLGTREAGGAGGVGGL